MKPAVVKRLCATIAAGLLAGSAAAVGLADAPADRYEVGSDTVKDPKTGLTWQRNISDAEYTWREAVNPCRALGSGWRLPALKELLTLVDPIRGSSPAIDTQAFPATSRTDVYWTASPFVGDRAQAWNVNFGGGGYASHDMIESEYSVRCVR